MGDDYGEHVDHGFMANMSLIKYDSGCNIDDEDGRPKHFQLPGEAPWNAHCNGRRVHHLVHR